jgi:glycosyltransferase involved in cell wall biosynthesis
MRFHLVSLPHTHTTDAFSACAFTEKVRKFAIMMSDLGHEVFLYAGAQNDAPCTEHIVCISEDDRRKAVSDGHYCMASFDANQPHWRTFNGNAIREIGRRIQQQDFICVIGGYSHKPIADAFPAHMTVEFGIGYPGTFAKYRVFESYAWMHTVYGAQAGNPAAADGQWFDEVIPGYFEVERFPYSAEKDDYYFFIGRLIDRKGYQIAVEVCKKLGKRLLIAGQGTPPEYGEYLGVIGPEERGRIMARAKAVFVPTIYIEPFGNVAVEAQGCGTPVISTDWGAMTETVEHGKTGFRCRTFQQFLDAAENVHTLDPAYIRQRAIDTYSLDVIGRKYDAYFRRLLTLWGEGWYAAA